MNQMKKTMNKRINRKIHKLLDKAVDLDNSLDEFLHEFVIPKFLINNTLKFKTPHPIGRYFDGTGISGSCVTGVFLRNRAARVPFNDLSILEKARLIRALQEEGVFDE